MAHRLKANTDDRGAFQLSARVLAWRVSSALALLFLAACAQGGASDIPVFRSIGWFGYLNGTDIRNACAAGHGDRYRLLYNAVWGEQVRDYEIAPDPSAPSGMRLTTRVLFPENLGAIDLTDPLRLYRGRTSAVALDAADLGDLLEALRRSGFYAPAPSGLVLPSDGYFWVLSSCENGVYHFNAYAYPSDRFAAIAFDAWLFRHDGSGVAVNAARPRPPRPPQNRVEVETRSYSVFDLQVGDGGLANILP